VLVSGDGPRFPYLELDLDEGLADEVGHTLVELGSDGVERRDDTTMSKGPGGGRVKLVASFATIAAAKAAADALTAEWPALVPGVAELVGDGWRDRYKEYFKPFLLTPRLVVAPPWVERPDAPRVLVMDPGRAFGTGLHATTAMVALQLDRDAQRLAGARLLDVGTGSGVLALTALLFGAAFALAIDNDPDVIEIVQENAARNGFAERLAVGRQGLPEIAERFAYVVANIRASVLSDMVGELRAKVAPGGRLVLSGILESEAPALKEAFGAQGFSLAEAMRREEPPHPDAWVALVLDG
jgi:ribosomal protein L11 methyltransferase